LKEKNKKQTCKKKEQEIENESDIDKSMINRMNMIKTRSTIGKTIVTKILKEHNRQNNSDKDFECG